MQILDRRPVRFALAGLTVLLLMVGAGVSGAVYASHQFPDVPNNNVFHDDIDWVVDQDIAGGFGDGTFRPNNPVTRAQFSAMLRAYADGTEVVIGLGNYSGATASASIECPDGKIPVGGGGISLGSDMYMTASYPYGVNADIGWSVWFESDNNVARSGTIWVYAICQPDA